MDLLLTFPWPTINGVLASGFTGDLTNATVWPAFSGATITRTQLFGAAYGSIQLSFFDGNGVYISGGIAGATASSAWQYVSNHVTAPSGAIYALVNLQSGNLRGTVTLFDSIKVTRDFTASTPFNPQGSMVPDQSIVFSFSTTSTSITISWSTQTKLRPDGSILTIPSGSLTFSSLSAITTYYIYAYVRVSDGALLFANPTPPTTSPSTLYAAQSALDGRIPLDVKAITTANTGSTGSGTGGGGDTCPDSGEHCDILGKGEISVFEAMPGEFVLGYSFRDKQDVYRKIISKSTKPCAAWYIVNGYKCSTMEPVWDSNNNVWTNSYLYPGSQFNGDIGILVGLTVESDSNDESNYYLVGKGGQRQLIHNVTMPPC